MLSFKNIFCLFNLLVFVFPLFATTHHDIKTRIDPIQNYLWVQDDVTLSLNKLEFCENRSYQITLHSNLSLIAHTSSWSTLLLTGSEMIDETHKLAVNHYLLIIPCDETKITFTYEGKIHHPLRAPANPYARGTADTPGIISDDGIVLSAGTYWYPQFNDFADKRVTFSLQTVIPEGWSVVSQGEEDQRIWREDKPQTDIYLIAARFLKYEEKTKEGTTVQVFLRTADETLAYKYLKATIDYIDYYSKLIAPFPYRKFALVENFWETGFGMPSFTLLGSTIIRLPFIINSSYPHEILHNWWGNSVYVDYKKGNWCEGLTAYLADHLMATKNGVGENYRRDTLMKYTDFVDAQNDFPLVNFSERKDAASEAIGYGKSLMFFHMLREQMGDIDFFKGLTLFYNENSFQLASYDEIKNSFEKITGKDFSLPFNQWTKRLGAPELQVSNIETVKIADNHFSVKAKIKQIQAGDAFALSLPVVFHFNNYKVKKNYSMMIRELIINESFDKQPLRLAVDPSFDIFRRLQKDEVPTVLTNALGASSTLFILPSNSVEWKKFSEIISGALHSKITVKFDSEITTINDEYTSVWVLGNNNLHLNSFINLSKDHPLSFSDNGIEFNNSKYPYFNHSHVVIARNKKSLNQVWTFVASDPVNSIETLANKLIHYGKYSLLIFEKKSVTNVAKGVWSVTDSSMSIPLTFVDLPLRQ